MYVEVAFKKAQMSGMGARWVDVQLVIYLSDQLSFDGKKQTKLRPYPLSYTQ